ncbi:hypothetical protein GLYMA_19G007550v4 [Glycine max]|nr:hypothetical protein GLYMA_19G007550v4 [Glycine max]KAH1075821.1 hypothetical protein GYH30_051639 [Glycine max]
MEQMMLTCFKRLILELALAVLNRCQDLVDYVTLWRNCIIHNRPSCQTHICLQHRLLL